MNFIINNKKYSSLELLKISSNSSWLKDIQIFLNDWLNPEINYIKVNTSGSTGIPKAIKLPKESLRKSAAITNNYFQLFNKISALCLPAKFIAGKMMIVRSIEANMDLILEEPSATPLIDINSRIDFVALTPLQLNNLIKYNPTQLNLLNTIIIGGGDISDYLMDKLKNISSQCYHTYGMTETITHIALKKLNGLDASDDFDVLKDFKISIDHRGCLVVEADHILNKKVITNDLVELVNSSSFKWLGRYDNIINSGGIKISPEIIEAKIQSIIPVAFFIGGLMDDALGHRVVLCLESTVWPKEKTLKLLNQIESRLSKFENPRSILFFDCFTYTPTGKIHRLKTLAKPFIQQDVR